MKVRVRGRVSVRVRDKVRDSLRDQVRVRVRASVRVRGVLELNIYSPIDSLLWRNFRETQVRYFIYKMTKF